MGPMLMLMPMEAEGPGAEEADAESRYTDTPDPGLVLNQTYCRGSTHIKEPSIKEGCAFIEPMAGQGGIDPYFWGG